MSKLSDRTTICHALKEFRNDYYRAKEKDKARIENNVRRYIEGVSDDVYCELNNNAASGLFNSIDFESDLDNAISLLSG